MLATDEIPIRESMRQSWHSYSTCLFLGTPCTIDKEFEYKRAAATLPKTDANLSIIQRKLTSTSDQNCRVELAHVLAFFEE